MDIAEILAALQAIIDQAVTDAGDARPLTDEEAERYEALETKLQAAQRSAQIIARQAAYQTVVPSPAGLGIGVPREDDTLARAFAAYLRTGRENADIVQLRAQSEGIGSEGGYTVPDTFRDKLVERLKAFGGIAEVAETITTSGGEPMAWPTVDDTSNVGEIVVEGGTFSSGANITFGVNSLNAYSYASGGPSGEGVRLSVELVQDSAIDIEALVTRLLGIRIGRIQATHLATGTGTAQPLGLVTGLTGVEIAADTAGIVYDDLINFVHSVDPAYREEGCRWVFNDTMFATIKKLKDSHGDPLWRPNTADMGTTTDSGQLIGYPITIAQQLPSMTAASNTINWGAFGNINRGYVVRRVRDVQIMVDPYTRSKYRQIEYTAWARMDATQQDTNAYVALTGEA